jgi:hypothetical protein
MGGQEREVTAAGVIGRVGSKAGAKRAIAATLRQADLLGRTRRK